MSDPTKNGSKDDHEVPDEEGIEDGEEGTDAAALVKRFLDRSGEVRASMVNAVQRTERAARRTKSAQNLRLTIPEIEQQRPADT